MWGIRRQQVDEVNHSKHFSHVISFIFFLYVNSILFFFSIVPKHSKFFSFAKDLFVSFWSATVRCGSDIPAQIPSGVWSLCANFLFPLSSNPLQPHQSIFSVVFLYSMFFPRSGCHYLFWHSLDFHNFNMSTPKELLSVFISSFCLVLWWWQTNILLVFSTFVSRIKSLLASARTCIFFVTSFVSAQYV